MPNPLINAVCSDAYTTAATCQDVWNSVGGWFFVTTNPVYFQLQYGPLAMSYWADELPLEAGASAALPKECVGFRFRNQNAGQNAIVSGQLSYGRQPLLDLTFPGASATTTGVAPIGQGHTTGTNGTPTVLGSALVCASVVVRALPANTGLVYLGDSAVTTSNGYELSAGDALGMDIDNVNLLYFDVDTNGEGVSWMAVG